VPPETGKKYEEEAKKKGDDVRLIVIESASHFEVIYWSVYYKRLLAHLGDLQRRKPKVTI